MKNVSWQLVSVIVVILATIIYLVPTLKPGVWPHKRINLGLDLQGGMHLVLEVDSGKAVESTVERITQEIRELLKKKAHPGRCGGSNQRERDIRRGQKRGKY